MTRTHEIKLDGYGAHTTLADDRPVMLLGTAESYGIEMLHVVSSSSWEGLTVTATFNAPDGTATDMLMSADGSITVPPEATAKSGSGKIVFTGVSNGIQRISCDLEYFVVAHSAINGVQSGGTAPSWFEQAAKRFMPLGGTTGQVLAKKTDADFDAEWQESTGGEGGITPTIGDNGNWYLGSTDTGKPSRGADGKSAYSYAQDGGYTGTEAEFAAKLAAEGLDKALYVVNLTVNSDGTFSVDKTFEEIIQAYHEGKYHIVLKHFSGVDGIILPLTTITESMWIVFADVSGQMYSSFEIRSDNKIFYKHYALAFESSKLPNPYPLTFTGAVNETYDGSSAKTIEIPIGADGITPTIGDNGNWFLGDVDTNKPSRGEKGPQGDVGPKGETGATGANGQSAYAAAQAGGYTGTEAEFAAKLAAEGLDKALYVVNITMNSDGTLSADKTFAEITQVYNEGKYHIVLKLCDLAEGILPLASIDELSIGFANVSGEIYHSCFIRSDNEILFRQKTLAFETTKLPNPYPLTFTGAVNETYDGSSAKTITIPSGGGSEGIYSLLVEHTITEDVSEVVYTNEEYPGIANLKHILVSIIFPEKQTTGWWKLVAGDVPIMNTTGVSNVKHYYGAADVKCGHWIWSGAGSSDDSAGQKLSPPSVEFNPRIGFIPTVYNDYSSLRIYGNQFTLTAGTVVRIWGCD